MSALSQSGSVLGASTIAAPLLASTGAPVELSVAVGFIILAVITAFYFVSKFRNKQVK